MLVPQFPYPIVGGLEHQALKLSRALIERGVAVTALSGKINPDQPRIENVDGVKVLRVDWRPSMPGHFRRTAAEMLSELVRLRRQIDVVHIHQNSSFGLFGIAAARLVGKPVLTKLPNVQDYGIPGIARSPFGSLRLACLKRSNGIVAMSSESLAELAEIDYPTARVLSVPNGVDCPAAPPIRRTDRPVVFSFIGRLEPEKNIGVLLRAWQVAAPRFASRASLRIYGRGSLERELKELCVNLGISDTAEFRGYCQNVSAALLDSDALAQPSAAEGNSNTILEAMASALPIISTRVGGTEMQVGQEGLQLLSEPGDVATLASQIVLLANDPALKRSIGLKMYERVRQNFDIRRIAGIYETAYKALAKGDNTCLAQLSGLPMIAAAD